MQVKELHQGVTSECTQGSGSVCVAAKEFAIPKSTLHDHVSGKHLQTGAGAPTVLSPREEQEIVLTCQVLAEMGFGMTRELVQAIVSDYVRENELQTSFVSGIPGRDWW